MPQLDLSLVGKPGEPSTFEYEWKDIVLYALGIGAKEDELDYLYEGRGPKTYPSFAVVPVFQPMFGLLAKTGGDHAMVVHGAQKVRMHKPIAPSGKLVTTATIRGIHDMKKFGVVIVDTASVDGAGDKVFDTTWNIIYRGHGSFGGTPPPREESLVPPKDTPSDFRVEETTTREQALLYRLSGDLNPLHADPKVARSAGFDRPILHGLATYGIAGFALIAGLCDGAPERFTSMHTRFSAPVIPGDRIAVDIWRERTGCAAFRARVPARGAVVLTNGRFEYAA